ncbi:hypothetical protein ACFOKI_08205 [Sphingomonas qilianensis]
MIGVLAGGAAPAPRAAPYQWQNVVVGGGGFAPGIVFSTAERGLAYLRTDMGGAYRWDAAAARWIPLQDGNAESSYMGVESIAPDPVNPDIVYLAAGMGSYGPAAIWRSADRGQNWTITRVPFAMGGNEDGRGLGERLAIDPHDRAHLLFGSRHDGLWESRDAGRSWSKAVAFPLAGLGAPTARRQTHGGLSFVVFDREVRGRVLVGSADAGDRHLFRSDDAGAHWAPVTGGPDKTMLPVKAVVGRDHVYTITYADGIGPNGITRGAVWRYDPAQGWSDVTPDKRPDAPIGGYMGVAVSAQDPRVIAVSTVDRFKPIDTVWRSTDAGRHWDELYRRSTRDVSASPFLAFSGEADFGHWIAGLAIDPFDASHAAYVTGATLYATKAFDRPGTMPWAPWTRGIEQTAVITLTSPTGGAPLVSGFGDIGGFRHNDLSVSPPHVHRTPFLSNTNTLDYAGRAPHVMVRSGSTHTREVPGASLAWSADGGTSWQPLQPPAVPRPAGADGPAPERTGDAPIVVSADGAVFLVESDYPVLTRDHGRSWQPVTGLPRALRPTADKADARRFYAIDFAASRVLRSDDGGATFHPIATQGLPADLSNLGKSQGQSREAQNALVATPGTAGQLWLKLGDDLYRSADAGARWTRVAPGLAITHYGLGRAAPGARWPAVYAIGRKDGIDGIWRSIDGGTRWQRINDAAHQWGLRFRVISGDPKRFGRVYIGTDGRGIVYGDPVVSAARATRKGTS